MIECSWNQITSFALLQFPSWRSFELFQKRSECISRHFDVTNTSITLVWLRRLQIFSHPWSPINYNFKYWEINRKNNSVNSVQIFISKCVKIAKKSPVLSSSIYLKISSLFSVCLVYLSRGIRPIRDKNVKKISAKCGIERIPPTWRGRFPSIPSIPSIVSESADRASGKKKQLAQNIIQFSSNFSRLRTAFFTSFFKNVQRQLHVYRNHYD